MDSSQRSDLQTMHASRYEQLVQTVADYAIYMLDLEGHVVSWNLGAQRIKGYNADEVIGRHFSMFFTPQDCAEGRPGWLLNRALSTGGHRTKAGACARTARSSGPWRHWM